LKLLLWDIDGTLLSTGGAGMRALEAAISAEFDLSEPVALGDIDWAGRTDGWIAEMICEKIGVEHTSEQVDRLLRAYVAELPRHLNARTEVLPGVREILAAAHDRDDVQQGLLTGNMKVGARTKLGHFDLWHYFPFGAFADDSPRRNDLGPHALRRAADHTGHVFDPAHVWIIGDTPHDIECGKVIGAKTLALSTGQHTGEQLAAGSPDAMLDSLIPAAKFWQALDI
jgi:phosphoglycolate phosphatase-like HAD superfamily hydrolase